MVAPPHARWPERVAQIVIASAVLLVPLAVAPNLQDRFRLIKDSVVRAEAFLLLFLLVAAIAFAGTERLRELLRERAALSVLAGVLVWTLLAALTSTQSAWSFSALVTVTTSAILFLSIFYFAPWLRLHALDLLVPAVIVTTAVLAMQEYGIWQPFASAADVPHHLRSTAFMDNPNVVGSYLTIAAVILAVAAMQLRGGRRLLFILGALTAVAGVFVSDTRSAVIALAAGLLLIGAVRSWKAAVVTIVLVLLMIGAAIALNLNIVERTRDLRSLATAGQWDILTSGRVGAGLTAWEMFRADPLTGLGPGTYGFNYMPYRIRVDAKYPPTLTAATRENFGETHNDHLQLLAEGGLPAYLLFLAAVGVIASARYRRTGSDDARSSFARALAVPLMGTLLVLCLAQFPLQVAVTRHLLLTFAALIAGWRNV